MQNAAIGLLDLPQAAAEDYLQPAPAIGEAIQAPVVGDLFAAVEGGEKVGKRLGWMHDMRMRMSRSRDIQCPKPPSEFQCFWQQFPRLV